MHVPHGHHDSVAIDDFVHLLPLIICLVLLLTWTFVPTSLSSNSRMFSVIATIDSPNQNPMDDPASVKYCMRATSSDASDWMTGVSGGRMVIE